jgi:HTH-type transcriptional regulator/antitoxin HipB
MIVRTPRDIGALIRQKRKDAGMDQATLARRVGVSRWWINEVEKGKPRAELGLVLQTLTTLGVSLDAVDRAISARAEETAAAAIARARGSAK